MDDLTKFEIKARVFRIMTGHMAPGKAASAASYPASFEQRSKVWNDWLVEYGDIVEDTIRAVEYILED